MARCQATRCNGTPCSYRARPGSAYCSIHAARLPELDDAADKGSGGRTLIGHVETLAKLAGLVGVVTALIGLPAVHVHFARLGIPSHFIDHSAVLKAGIIPTALLALFMVLIASLVRKGRASAQRAPVHALLALLMVPTLVPLVVGLVAYVVLIAWSTVWLVHWLLGAKFGVEASNREMLYAAIAAVSLLGLVGLIYRCSSAFRAFVTRLLSSEGWLWRSLKRLDPGATALQSKPGDNLAHRCRKTQTGGSALAATAAQQTAQQPVDKELESARDWLRLIPMIWLVVPLVFVGLLYAIKAIVFLWEPAWSGYLSHKIVLWLTACATAFYCLPVTAIGTDDALKCKHARVRSLGVLEISVAVLLSYAVLASFYTSVLYPNLSGAWGGGRLVPISLWLDAARVPDPKQFAERLPGARITMQGTTAHVDSIYLAHAADEIVIVVGAVAEPSGLALPRGAIRAIGWPHPLKTGRTGETVP